MGKLQLETRDPRAANPSQPTEIKPTSGRRFEHEVRESGPKFNRFGPDIGSSASWGSWFDLLDSRILNSLRSLSPDS